MNEKRKWVTAARLRRGAVLAGTVGLVAGTAALSAGPALAGVGSQPGNLALNPASGALSLTPTWSTSSACPAGFQASAEMSDYTTGGTLISRISPVVSAGLTGPFSGTLDGSMQLLLNQAGIASAGGTVEFVIGCYAGAGGTGAVSFTQSTFVTVPAAGGTFTTSATGPVITATTTTLTAAPSPAATGATVTLTANVSAADSTTPAGTVQFEVGGTAIGTPVAVNTGGVATAAVGTTTFAAAGTEALSAVFTPTAATYASSTGTFSLLVQAAGTQTATGSPVPISLTITASGSLTVSVVNTAVPLTLNAAGTQATGTLGNVTIADTRNTSPGWSVSGQEANFAGSGTAAGFSIPGDDLGWVPASVGGLVGGAVLGPTVAPGTSPGGLGDTGAVLIHAAAGNGFGTNVANAALTLNIPTGQRAGAYAGSMSVTYLLTGP